MHLAAHYADWLTGRHHGMLAETPHERTTAGFVIKQSMLLAVTNYLCG